MGNPVPKARTVDDFRCSEAFAVLSLFDCGLAGRQLGWFTLWADAVSYTQPWGKMSNVCRNPEVSWLIFLSRFPPKTQHCVKFLKVPGKPYKVLRFSSSDASFTFWSQHRATSPCRNRFISVLWRSPPWAPDAWTTDHGWLLNRPPCPPPLPK